LAIFVLQEEMQPTVLWVRVSQSEVCRTSGPSCTGRVLDIQVRNSREQWTMLHHIIMKL